MHLLVSSLEPSANLHLEPILKKSQNIKISGIFDTKFGTPLYPSDEFSVMGFLDVLPKIFKAKKAIKQMVKLSKECEKVLLIDSPAFNIPLAKAIKKEYPNKKIIYYILPKVWAWKKSRAKKVEKYCDILASIFPFEDKFYKNSIYVGNPLLDEIKSKKEPSKKYNNIAFLPGSRKSEIKKLMPIYKNVAKRLNSNKTLVVPKFFKSKNLSKIYGDISEFNISYNLEDSLTKSDFAFICSGTATLEAAIIGLPFVLTYKAKSLDYFIGKKVVKLSHVGLANILMDFENKSQMHEELLQDEVTVENLLRAYEKFDYTHFYQKSKELKSILKYGSVDNMLSLL